MQFTSYTFLFLFLPIVYAVFLLAASTQKTKWPALWLLLASIGFYAFWNPSDLWPLVASVLGNFGFYKLLQISFIQAHPKTSRVILGVAILCNLLFLGFYKYLNSLVPVGMPIKSNEIPLGISFYTFTQIAFLVDIQKRQCGQSNFLNYSLFVSYFPHLMCGPILSFKDLAPQLANSEKFRATFHHTCLFLFCFSIGLFKKAVIGDNLGAFASQVMDGDPNRWFDLTTAWLGIMCYSMQLYFDFSGYSDMAVGLSYLFGLKIPDNFNAPYQSGSIIEFWRRWHMSLSQFLKHYVYIPLGGNRGGALQSYRNLWATMILGGLWHGASWNFFLWGIYHGTLLCINHLIRNYLPKFNFLANTLAYFPIGIARLKVFWIFLLVSMGWILFRTTTPHHAIHIYYSLIGWVPKEAVSTLTFSYKIQWIILALAFGIAFLLPDTPALRVRFEQLLAHKDFHFTLKRVRSVAAVLATLTLLGVLCFGRVQYFLYAGF